jgi:hypothetical protein
MKARPDVMVVGHTYAYYSVLFSAPEQELAAFNHEGANLICNLARFRETAGLINMGRVSDARWLAAWAICPSFYRARPLRDREGIRRKVTRRSFQRLNPSRARPWT